MPTTRRRAKEEALQPQFSVIVPTYKEAENLTPLAESIALIFC